MYSVKRLTAFLALGGYCLFTAACIGYGVKEERLPETGATLEGTVTYGNEKVEAALIIVSGPNGSATGFVDEATGRFKIPNVPLGEVKVAVNTDAAKGNLQGKAMSGYYAGPEAKAKGRTTPPKIIELPKKYQAPDTSGITTTTKTGNNVFDVNIPK